MKIAIAMSYNGVHREFKRALSHLGLDSFYFNIDSHDWYKVEQKKPTCYLWQADNKEENYRQIYDKIYFIQNIFSKPVLPDLNMYFAQGDKFKQFQILDYLKIYTPKTFITTRFAQAIKIIKRIKYPFILKDPYGYGGQHVFKIDCPSQALKFIHQIFNSGLTTNYSTFKNIFYAQEFIPSDRDLRVITIGGDVFCAYWRIGQAGSWKHNLDQGAKVSFENIPSVALKLCQRISRRMRFHWMAYDLIFRRRQPLITEYSCNFAVKGATQGGFDVRYAQMLYLKNYLLTYGRDKK